MILPEPNEPQSPQPAPTTAQFFAAGFFLGPIAFLWARNAEEKAAVVVGWTAGPFPGPFTPL